MGSRFMHLLVADYVATEFNIMERGSILLGSIAPDAGTTKRDTHFKGQLHPYAYNAPLDYGRFVQKYRHRMSEPFFLGYLTHLVTDDVWTMKTDFSGFEQRLKQQPELYQIYHGDLRLCNAKLDALYRPDGVYQALSAESDVPDLDELESSQVLEYKVEALNDFEYPAENVTEPLKLFTFEDMVQYVERSKSKALDVCRIVQAFA